MRFLDHMSLITLLKFKPLTRFEWIRYKLCQFDVEYAVANDYSPSICSCPLSCICSERPYYVMPFDYDDAFMPEKEAKLRCGG